MLRRFWAIFVARNKEFVRDKSALGWNFLFPFLVIIGFSFIFSEEKHTLYKVGVIGEAEPAVLAERFQETRFIEFVTVPTEANALEKLAKHKFDLVLQARDLRYWVATQSSKGYIVEKLLRGVEGPNRSRFQRQEVPGRKVPYLEWLFPGILGLNMMFSALFGVGYVLVRYRKNGVLKRLKATPINAFEFLTAQIASRMVLLMGTATVVYLGCTLFYPFVCRGSLFDLFLIYALGGFSMVSVALVIASRTHSEEFAGGALNLLSWPMMFLSQVWFSLEGAEEWVVKAANLLPLTHMIEGARKIMNDGAGLGDVSTHVMALLIMGGVGLGISSLTFRWEKV